MQLNFYILSPQKPLIPFVCQLAQTVLQKSDAGLLIFAPHSLLEPLDEMLWSFDATAFIPHCIVATNAPTTPTPEVTHTPQTTSSTHETSHKFPNLALLTADNTQLQGFTGLVMNLTTEPVLDCVQANTAHKLFEIIAHDEVSVIHGRQKFRHYRTAFPQLPIQTFKIS